MAKTSVGSIPRTLLKQETQYRTVGIGGGVGVSGCGFILKPDRHIDIVEKVPNEYVLVYVLRGEGEYIDWQGNTHLLSAGCAFQRLPGKLHSSNVKPDGLWAECFIMMDAAFFEMLSRYGTVDNNRPVLYPGLHRTIAERFDAILKELKKSPDEIKPQTLLHAHELLVDIYAFDSALRAPSPHDEMVREACEILSGDLRERIALEELASGFHLSYERFRKVFRQRVGFSPGDYRIRKRIERACNLLVQEGYDVTQTAYELGYADIYSFSKQFKKVMGVSPNSFRLGMG